MKRLAPVAVALALLAGCAVTLPPRPAPPPVGDLQMPELAPVHEDLSAACGEVQQDGTVVCQAAKLEAVAHKAIELYHNARQTAAMAEAERRHRVIDGEAYEVALDERDAMIEDLAGEWWRGFGMGAGVGLGTAGAAWGAVEMRRVVE